ncbi:MAG: GntR family transcriptional regulator [Acidobacteriaceae bacterium]
MDIQIDKISHVPIYDQIKEQIKGLIHAGQVKTGDQLPTIRELSVDLSVNFNTVALAYRDLVNEGVIITERGKGTFVASTPGVEAMQTIRHEKLKNLVENLFKETDRLGYSHEEVHQAFISQMNKESGSSH